MFGAKFETVRGEVAMPHLAHRSTRAAIDRRDFLAGITASAAFAAGGAAAADLGRARTVSIFHTTDLHGRILPTRSLLG